MNNVHLHVDIKTYIGKRSHPSNLISNSSLQTTQYEAGKDALEREFRNLLNRHTKPMSPVALLDLLSADEEGEVEPQPLQQMSGKVFPEI